MVIITKDLKEFIEKYNDEIMIYGAGNAGFWVGHYMSLCDIQYSCYLDKRVVHQGSLLNERPIFLSQERLTEYKGSNIRIFVSIENYTDAIVELTYLSQKYDFSALCYIPVGYVITEANSANRKESYCINASLSYFRKKLFKGTVPTILSNDCSAGGLYQILGLTMISPTINIGILEDDYIKLCNDPRHYFDIEVSTYEYGRMLFYINGKWRELLNQIMNQKIK